MATLGSRPQVYGQPGQRQDPVGVAGGENTPRSKETRVSCRRARAHATSGVSGRGGAGRGGAWQDQRSAAEQDKTALSVLKGFPCRAAASAPPCALTWSQT